MIAFGRQESNPIEKVDEKSEKGKEVLGGIYHKQGLKQSGKEWEKG